LKTLNQSEHEFVENGKEGSILVSWKPEYANYMLEATPYKPFSGSISSVFEVEDNIAQRVKNVKKYLKQNEILITMTNFPLLGARNNFTIPKYTQKHGKFADSFFLPDEILNPHPRFR